MGKQTSQGCGVAASPTVDEIVSIFNESRPRCRTEVRRVNDLVRERESRFPSITPLIEVHDDNTQAAKESRIWIFRQSVAVQEFTRCGLQIIAPSVGEPQQIQF